LTIVTYPPMLCLLFMPISASLTPKSGLIRILGIGFGIAVIFGGTIGVGILRLPGTVAAQVPDYWLILLVWTIGGLYSLLGSISVAELGAMLPQAGGFYVYAKRAFGDFVGFASGWGDWLNNCASLAYVSITAGDYLSALFPQWPLFAHGKAVALSILALFTALQWMGVRLSSTTQKVTSSATAAAFLVLIIACLVHPAANSTGVDNLSTVRPLSQSAFGMIGAMIVALRAVIVSYDGWYEAIYFTEEDVNPAYNFPRIMIGGVLMIIVMYLLVNLALLRVLPIPQLAASKLPAADAAQIVFGQASGRLILVLSLLTLLSFVNSVLLGATRIIFAISRDGFFLARAATVSAGGTPRIALLVTSILSMLLVATGTFERTIAIAAVFFVANYALTYLALIVLRRREPALPRPFRAWGYPWTPMIVLIGSLLFLGGAVVSDTGNSVYALAILAASVPIYLVTASQRAKTSSRENRQ
jgi:APA family basic amino acid/polyamine antiporter